MTEQQFVLWEHEAADAGDLRPIHYLGTKLRLLDTIEELVDDVDPIRGRALDLFSGSGVVARRLSRSREVLAVDIQEYARVLAAALLSERHLRRVQSEAILDEAQEFAEGLLRGPLRDLAAVERDAIAASLAGDPARLATLIEHGSILSAELESDVSSELDEVVAAAAAEMPSGPATVLTRYYGGVYFSYAHAALLDGLAAASRGLGVEERDGALATVLSTASDLVSSVGNHFAQPIRPRKADGRLKRVALAAVARRRQLDLAETYGAWSDRYRTLEPPAFFGRAVRGDYRAMLAAPPQSVSVVYADPPYTRDHYSRFYHVLETITLGDEPEVSPVRIGGTSQLSRGLYRAERHQSPFCIKSKAPAAFDALFGLTRALDVPLILSYSPYGQGHRPRLMTIEQICAIGAEHYGSVDVCSAGRVAHSKLNADHLNAEVVYEAEVLVVCRP
jgi:16S rRNA G966 N2-methylase RsmD